MRKILLVGLGGVGVVGVLRVRSVPDDQRLARVRSRLHVLLQVAGVAHAVDVHVLSDVGHEKRLRVGDGLRAEPRLKGGYVDFDLAVERLGHVISPRSPSGGRPSRTPGASRTWSRSSTRRRRCAASSRREPRTPPGCRPRR